MNGAVTNGERAYCEQHITAQVMEYDIILRVHHGKDCHDDNGHCLNCGQVQWTYNAAVGVYQCVPCTAQGIMTAQGLLPLDTFPKAPDPLLASLPHAHSLPKEEIEQARSAQYAKSYLEWRLIPPPTR